MKNYEYLHVCSFTDPPEHIIGLYKAFLTINGIINYTPSLELQMKMNNNNSQSANEDNNREKENIHVNNTKQPNKQKKLIFTIGHLPIHQPTWQSIPSVTEQ